jgi:hypothetical protein
LRQIKLLGSLVVVSCIFAVLFATAASASVKQFQIGVAPSTIKAAANTKFKMAFPEAGSFSEYSNCEISLTGSSSSKTVSSVSGKIDGGGKMPCVTGFGTLKWNTGSCEVELKASGGLAISKCGTQLLELYVPGACRITLGNQAVGGLVQYVNNAGKTETSASPTVSGLTYTVSNCEGYGTNGTYSDGVLSEGTWTLSASTTGGVKSSISLEEGPPTEFAAESAPVTLAGGTAGGISKTGKTIRFGENGLLSCNQSYSGSMSTRTATSVKVVPKYHNCTYSGYATGPIEVPDSYVTAGGCSYEFTYPGNFAIVGESCAAKPITITIPNCVLTVGPQSGSEVFAMSTTGAGTLREVVATKLSKEWLTSTATGSGCLKAGTFHNGEVFGGNLSAKTSGGSQQGFFLG